MKQFNFSRLIILTIVGAVIVAGSFFAGTGGIPGARRPITHPVVTNRNANEEVGGVSIIWTAQGEEKAGWYEVIRTDLDAGNQETLLATVQPGTRVDRSGYYHFVDKNPPAGSSAYEVRYTSGSKTRTVSSVAMADKNG